MHWYTFGLFREQNVLFPKDLEAKRKKPDNSDNDNKKLNRRCNEYRSAAGSVLLRLVLPPFHRKRMLLQLPSELSEATSRIPLLRTGPHPRNLFLLVVAKANLKKNRMMKWKMPNLLPSIKLLQAVVFAWKNPNHSI